VDYKLSINLGTTYLVWCLLDLDSNGKICDLRDMGIRIFRDGRDPHYKEPLAVGRRAARHVRRRRDRYKSRQRRLMTLMTKHGLMPEDDAARKQLEQKDPYELRVRALDEKLSLHDLGRALFHINQRRGFKSNRRTDPADSDTGAINAGIAELRHALQSAGSRTLGEYLARKHRCKETVRARPRIEARHAAYDFFPDRAMYEHEIDAILHKQRTYYPDLFEKIGHELKRIILYQRPLKPPAPGRCILEAGEARARIAYPAVQSFRILNQVRALELATLIDAHPPLTDAERAEIIGMLHESESLSFAAIRKLLKRGTDVKFNYEAAEGRKGMQGNATAFYLAAKECFGERWYRLTDDQQNAVVDLLLDEADPDTASRRLVAEHGLTPEQAERAVHAPLNDEYDRLSLKAIHHLLPHLKRGRDYTEACRKAGYHAPTRETWHRLPYYGQALPHAASRGTYAPTDKDSPETYYGRINDPSAHIALNQLRKLVNAVIDLHGLPTEAVVQVAPELKFRRDRLQAWTKRQKANQARTARIDAELQQRGITPTDETRLRFKLWEDQAQDAGRRCCPFTGRLIGPDDIFSGAFVIADLLPFCRSFHDSPANKVLSHRSAILLKGTRSPYEAFGPTPEWGAILARAENLPPSKQWRFRHDAWDIAAAGHGDVITRHLNDPAYMSRVVRDYLACIVPQQDGQGGLYSVSGHLTPLLREAWDLNTLARDVTQGKLRDLLSAKRADPALLDSILGDELTHFHCAVDVFVVGCTDRPLLESLGRESSKMLENGRSLTTPTELSGTLPEPFPGYAEQVRDCLERIVVSYKPDHGNARAAIHALRPRTVSKLHQETAYGLADPRPDNSSALYVTRKPIAAFTSRADIESVADLRWRLKLLAAVEGFKDGSAQFKAAVAAFAQKQGIRRLRVLIARAPETMIPIYQPHDKGRPDARPYKHYARGSNYGADIYCPDKGPQAGQWGIEIVSCFHAHQKEFIPQWQKDHPTARRIMRLQIDDMVAYSEAGVTRICRVKMLALDLVYLLDHRLAKDDGNRLYRKLSPRQMQKFAFRKISVDLLGCVRDRLGKVS